MNLLLGVALVLGLMIMIHEWGHFIVARLFKVRVDVFSIGFGPRLFGWKSGATDWRISALPFGGYVRMAGQDMSDVDAGDKPPTGSSDELMSKPRWQRALISFAGPAVNLIFPVVALAVLFIVFGVPHSAYLDQPVQVVALSSKSDAQTSPFRPGDKILSLNGVANPTWEQAAKVIKNEAPGSRLNAEVENGGVRRSVETTLGDSASTDRMLGYPPLLPVLDEVASSQPRRIEGRRYHPICGWSKNSVLGTIRRSRSRFGREGRAVGFAAQRSNHSHPGNSCARCDRIWRKNLSGGRRCS
jgi:regulator of sigma E protease